ncbi:MAG: preprotein translocase subunit SecG [Cyclobacteriaceae bacterium]|nr:preprotein translocase subunit SecG [Cyclobacteriaceae bacterium]
MFTVIVTFIVIAALLITLVVLAQNSKGGGLSNQFGGSGTSQVMGVKKTGDLLEKLTWGLAIAIMVLSLTAHATLKNAVVNPGMSSPILEQAEQQTILPPAGNTMPLESTDTTGNSSLDGLLEESN